MRSKLFAAAAALWAASVAGAVEVTALIYDEGELNFSLRGTGTVAVNAQADYKYISAKTGEDSLARATSEPMEVELAGEETPVKILFLPPEGSVTEVEIIIFVDGEEMMRQTFYY
ncbi:MAG: hypothetical protein GTN49_10570 [candidate division Zixibacteria bacterium]|nr:hypothetical protein [candidate division Zixibacteria bacterium]